MEKELARFRSQKAQEYSSQKQARGTFKVPECMNTFLGYFSTIDMSLDKWILALKIVFWLVLWKVFILLEFGTVFFMLSMFYWVYASMSCGSRKQWEPSAYSVFNKDFETIDGTFTAEQFERELKFGPGAVSNN